MSSIKLIFSIILFVFAGLQIFIVFNLYSKSKKLFYQYYLYYLVFIHVFIIINLYGREIVNLVLNVGTISNSLKISIGMYLNFIALPFLFIAIYIFILFSYHITNRILPKFFKIFYWFINLLEIILFINLLVRANKHGFNALTELDNILGVILGNMTMVFFVNFAIFQLIFNNQKIEDLRLKRNIRYLGLLYFFINTTWFLFLFVFQDKIKIGFYPFYTLVFAMNFIPVLFMKFKLNNILSKPITDSLSEFQGLYDKYKITTKESEIIYLIRDGKSNKEIADILFISIQTVKNTISNIYKKLEIKSRTGLIKFIQSNN